MEKNEYKFALSLYQEILKTRDTENNIFVSPYSISAALSMVLLGAEQNTESELQTVLGSNVCLIHIHDYHKNLLLKLLELGKSVTLNIANKLFVEKSFELFAKFMQDSIEYYHTDVESMPFSTDSRNSRRTINNWVEKKTENKIKDLLPSDAINELTRLVIVNAVYFKSDWESKFKKKKTQKEKFFVSKKIVKKVQMMTQKSKFLVCHNRSLGVHIVNLPYQNKAVSMLLLVPTDRFGISSVEAKLTNETLQQVDENIFRQEVILSMPKFKLEDSFDMKPILKSMGIKDAFDVDQANFSGISSERPLYVSDVHHKCFVDVNEEGTEAAAATAAVIKGRCIKTVVTKPLRIICDHPFMYMIRHNPSKTVLFLGRFATP